MREVITTCFLAIALLVAGGFMIIKNTWMYKFHQEFRNQNPITQLFNPFGDCSPKASKAVSILIGVMMVLTAVFLITLVIARSNSTQAASVQVDHPTFISEATSLTQSSCCLPTNTCLRPA